jgi:hypothetical protein
MKSHLKKLRAELEGALAGVSGEDLLKAPAGKWSPAQILEHLYLTYKGTNLGIAKCMKDGKPLATKSSMKHRVGKLVVLSFAHMPEGRKSPERALPKGLPADEVRGAIFSEVDKMVSGLDDCERRFGVSAKIMDHPVLGPLTASEWAKFHWVHGRHHARQIRERAGSQK